MRSFNLAVVLFALVTSAYFSAYAMAAGEAAAQAPVSPVNAEIGTDGVQRATLTLDSYNFTPSHLVVEAGKPVELTLNNVSSVAPHSLIMDDANAGFSLSQDVSAGKSAVVRFTPGQSGSFAFYCDKKLPLLPSHRKKGMEGVLEVR